MLFLKNMKIQGKILLGYAICIALTIIIVVFNRMALNRVSNEYVRLQNELNAELKLTMASGQEFATCRRNYLAVYSLGALSTERLEGNYDAFTKTLNNAIASLSECLAVIDKNSFYSPQEKQLKSAQIQAIIDKMDTDYRSNGALMYEAIKNNLPNDQSIEIGDEGTVVSVEINNLLDLFIEENQTNSLDRVTQNVDKYASYSLILTVFAIIISVIAAIIGARMIRKPISQLMADVRRVAGGDLNVAIGRNARDEIGMLSQDIASVVDNFRELVNELAQASEQMAAGDIDVKINEEKFRGDFRKVSAIINQTFEQISIETESIVQITQEYGKGNFDNNIQRFQGKKAILHESFDEMKHNLQSVNNEINHLIHNAISGNLNAYIALDKYSGQWRIIMENLNQLTKAVGDPVKEVADVLSEVALANFDVSIKGNYEGQFLVMKNAVNETVTKIAGYIHNINEVLRRMSNQDLDITVTDDYIGDFKMIELSLKHIISTFNEVLHSFERSAKQVSNSANQVSTASGDLAQGVCEQTGAVREVKEITGLLLKQIDSSRDSALLANQLSMSAKDKGEEGEGKMLQMLEAMKDIEKTSSNISTVIKVIDDISFQTNILALNASVEAARAGEHGRGFSVVAQEVRNLAGRSQLAVTETESLINKTLDVISNGSQIANRTAKYLNEIVRQITEIAELIEKITASSSEQQNTILKIDSNISQISKVSESSQNTSDEVASYSLDLTNQAEVFHQNIGLFHLQQTKA